MSPVGYRKADQKHQSCKKAISNGKAIIVVKRNIVCLNHSKIWLSN
jgi:hypothetical protein